MAPPPKIADLSTVFELIDYREGRSRSVVQAVAAATLPVIRSPPPR